MTFPPPNGMSCMIGALFFNSNIYIIHVCTAVRACAVLTISSIQFEYNTIFIQMQVKFNEAHYITFIIPHTELGSCFGRMCGTENVIRTCDEYGCGKYNAPRYGQY